MATQPQTPKQFAKSVTFEARSLNKRGPTAKALIQVIDQAYFQAVKTQNAGNEELAGEFAAVAVDALIRLKSL
jgi:hypothetical protein